MSNLNLEYEAIVLKYIRERRLPASNERLYIQRIHSLNEAISFACKCLLPNGKRHPHQYRIPSSSLEKVHKKLLSVNFSIVSSFDELHELIKSEISNINKIGPLTIYDIAHRIGTFLNLEPEHIYLHRGTMVGAKALGLNIIKGKIAKKELPLPFQKLSAQELEDCLCLYKGELCRLNNYQYHKAKLIKTRPTCQMLNLNENMFNMKEKTNEC